MAARYLAITPARDEEKLLPKLIESMRAQTIVPARWIIIDDGSTDRTAAIIDEAARATAWIEPRHLKSDRPRKAGGNPYRNSRMKPWASFWSKHTGRNDDLLTGRH